MNTQNQNTQVAALKKDISAQVLEKVEQFQQTGELRIPENYSPANALKAAYLILAETKNRDGKFALEYCTKESIANALLKMVVWGLSPLKKQCDFIMYGNKLECSIEYTGNIALAKRYGGLKTIKPVTVFEGDIFEFEVDTETGLRKVTKHKQTLDSMGSNKVKGAYAVMTMNDGTVDTEIMTWSMILAAWEQGATKGKSPAHTKFPDQMANKTVINRGTKPLIRSSDDSVLFYNDEDKVIDVAKENVQHEINQNANTETIGFDTYEEAEIVEENHQEIINNHNEMVEQEAPQTVMDGPGF